jgi:dipeptidyl aminopeptidase/acylaminoacyl peptidase
MSMRSSPQAALNPRSSSRACAGIAAVAALAITAAPAQATFPGVNGRILFQSQVGKHLQLFTVRPDGRGLRQVTHLTNSDAVHGNWSPDGRRIAFERDFADRADTLETNADGGGTRTLVHGGFAGEPAFAPDGHRLVMTQQTGKPATPNFDNSLWTLGDDGDGPTRLTAPQPPNKAGCPCVSTPEFAPDGRRVVFARALDARRSAIITIGTDGSGERRLTPWRLGAFMPHWSPDGTTIAFNSYPDQRPSGASANVFVVRADGSGLHALTHERGGRVNAGMGSWSPDGRSIVFPRFVVGRDAIHFHVYVMRADGTHRRQLVHREGRLADWGTRPTTAASAAADPARAARTPLDGTYEVTWTPRQLVAAGTTTQFARENSGHLTMTLRRGVMHLDLDTPPGCVGRYTVRGQRFSFRLSPPSCTGSVTARWSLRANRLRLRVINTAAKDDGIVMAGKPWKKTS